MALYTYRCLDSVREWIYSYKAERRTDAYMNAYKLRPTQSCTHTHTHTHTCVYVCVCIYIYIYLFIYTYVCMYI